MMKSEFERILLFCSRFFVTLTSSKYLLLPRVKERRAFLLRLSRFLLTLHLEYEKTIARDKNNHSKI